MTEPTPATRHHATMPIGRFIASGAGTVKAWSRSLVDHRPAFAGFLDEGR